MSCNLTRREVLKALALAPVAGMVPGADAKPLAVISARETAELILDSMSLEQRAKFFQRLHQKGFLSAEDLRQLNGLVSPQKA